MIMKTMWTLTKREQLGTIDGLNLFFGALLGANLGTLGTLSLYEYGVLILLLAGMVVTIRLVSTSERRIYSLALLAFYLAIVGAILFVPGLQPKGLAVADLHRLAVTLAIWVAAVLFIELYPTVGAGKDQA